MKHIKNFRLFEAHDKDDNFIIDAETEQSEFEDVSELFEDIREMLGFVVNEAALFDVKKDLKALEREREALVKKLKELPSPGAYASKAKSDLDAVEKKIKDLKKEKTKILVPKK